MNLNMLIIQVDIALRKWGYTQYWLLTVNAYGGINIIDCRDEILFKFETTLAFDQWLNHWLTKE